MSIEIGEDGVLPDLDSDEMNEWKERVLKECGKLTIYNVYQIAPEGIIRDNVADTPTRWVGVFEMNVPFNDSIAATGGSRSKILNHIITHFNIRIIEYLYRQLQESKKEACNPEYMANVLFGDKESFPTRRRRRHKNRISKVKS